MCYVDSIPGFDPWGWEDPLEKEKGYILQDSGLGNVMDSIGHVVAKSHSLSLLSLSYPERLDEPDGLRLKPSERC